MHNNTQNSFSKNFVQGEVLMGFWSFVKKGVGALDSFFILKALTLYQFGAYQLLLSGYAILSDFFHDIFSETISNDIFRFVGEKKEAEAKKLFYEYALFRLVMASIPWAVIFFGAPYFSSLYGEETIKFARILSFLFLADATVSVAMLLLKLRTELKLLAVRPTMQKFTQLCFLMYFFFFADLGIAEIFISQIVAVVLTVILLIPALYRSIKPWLEIRATKEGFLWRAVKSYGKWELPRSLLSDFMGKVRPWIIKVFLSTEAVGIFGVAYTFISALKDLLPIRTLGILAPQKAHDVYYMNFLYIYGTKYFLWLSLILTAVSAIGVPFVITLLFPQYHQSIGLFYLLLPVLPVFAFSKIITAFLVINRQQKFIFQQSLAQNIAMFLFLVIFLPFFQISGLALAEIFGSLFTAGTRYLKLVRAKIITPFPFRKLFVFEDEDKRIFSVVRGHARSLLPVIFHRA